LEVKALKIYRCAEELIGKTPLLELRAVEKKYDLKANIIAKLEYLNPAGSAKDRVAKAMLDDAEKRGLISAGAVIIEPTSGNTGIGLASVAATRGYKTIIVMPDSMSEERRTILKAYGAELVLTDAALGMKGCIEKAEEIARETPNSFIPGQFDNPANARAHEETTGPEIWEDTDGNVDIFVAGVGTGGTITGVGHYLKSKDPNVKIVAVEPKSSPLLSKGSAASHGIQGIGANFVPNVLDRSLIDKVVRVSTSEAEETACLLARKEGVLAGVSSGAAVAAALKLVRQPEWGEKTVVAVLPDTGERYLSTGLYF
jgi:cysteine synthase A